MAITPKDAIERFRNAARILSSSRRADLLLITQETAALVKSRVLTRGEAASGSKFKPYSEAVVPLPFYQNKEARSTKAYGKLYKAVTGKAQGGKRKGQPTKGVGGWFASYKDWREVNNLKTGFKNFDFTGEMWRSIKPVMVKNTREETVFEVKSNSKEGNDKLRWNSEREGISLLAINKEEERLLRKAYEERTNKRIKEAGL